MSMLARVYEYNEFWVNVRSVTTSHLIPFRCTTDEDQVVHTLKSITGMSHAQHTTEAKATSTYQLDTNHM